VPRHPLAFTLAVVTMSCAHPSPLVGPGADVHWATLEREQPKRDWGFNIFIDTLTIHRVSDSTYDVWLIVDYDTALASPRGYRYIRVAMHQRIDCGRETVIPLLRLDYDTARAAILYRGSDPDSLKAAAAAFHPPRTSVAHAIWRKSCVQIQHEPWHFGDD
jgi:hypothetical protein